MKKLLLLLLLPGFIYSQNNAGDFYEDFLQCADSIYRYKYTAKVEYSISIIDTSNNLFSSDDNRIIEWAVYGLIDENTGEVSDNPLLFEIIGDTTCAMIHAMQQQQRTNNMLWAAEDILKFITLDGEVTNNKWFDDAVKQYIKMKKSNGRDPY